MEYLYFLYTDWLHKFNIPATFGMVTFPLLPFCIIAVVLIVAVLVLVLGERKLLGFFTQRKGPNRVGPWGILQTIADAIKLLCKENINPKGIDFFMYNLAPVIAFVPVMVVWFLIPFASEFDVLSYSVGALLFVSVTLIPLLGTLLAGYSSNNKYSLIGSIRAVAQVISYELPMMFVLVSIVVLSSSLNLKQIVLAQSGSIFSWNIITCFLGFLIMFISAIAELNRCPFDLSEAESELVSGYNTEYSGMRFAFFFLGEYAMMFVMCAFLATLFLGGFLSPFGFYLSEKLTSNQFYLNILIYLEQIGWLMLKTAVLIFAVIWVRATLPRLKINQLNAFAWKFLLPLAFLNLFVVCLLKELILGSGG